MKSPTENLASQRSKIDEYIYELPDEVYRADLGYVYKVHGYNEQGTWLGKEFDKEELIRKVFYFLTFEWDSKIIVIKDSYNLSKILFEIHVNLILHETRLKECKKRQE